MKKFENHDIHNGHTMDELSPHSTTFFTSGSARHPTLSSPRAMSHIIVPPRPLMIYASGRVLCISVQRASAFFLSSHPGVAVAATGQRKRKRKRETGEGNAIVGPSANEGRGGLENHKASQSFSLLRLTTQPI